MPRGSLRESWLHTQILSKEFSKAKLSRPNQGLAPGWAGKEDLPGFMGTVREARERDRTGTPWGSTGGLPVSNLGTDVFDSAIPTMPPFNTLRVSAPFAFGFGGGEGRWPT